MFEKLRERLHFILIGCELLGSDIKEHNLLAICTLTFQTALPICTCRTHNQAAIIGDRAVLIKCSKIVQKFLTNLDMMDFGLSSLSMDALKECFFFFCCLPSLVTFTHRFGHEFGYRDLCERMFRHHTPGPGPGPARRGWIAGPEGPSHMIMIGAF